MTDQHQQVRVFLGWLSAELPELHHVDIGRLSDAFERFKSAAALATPAPVAAPPADLVALVREWQISSRDLDDRVSREELPEHDQASENALHAAHRRHEAAIRALLTIPLPDER